ncbi:MAG: methylmalonyl Co-A mutase-associated GTPase MeaB [Elusimicrobia bacterium]|nr:methylmalonyl Co-A mutase-associated GTPase MeaB [Elusimicrobiota bacterium]
MISTPHFLVQKITQSDHAATARALSIVTDEETGYEELSRHLFPFSGKCHKIGLCGPPGSGKSSLINELLPLFRAQNLRVGVLVVDPSSAMSGGAFLGDRLRIQRHALDERIFIRSLASRGRVGGIPASIFGAIHVLEAFGSDKIIIETTGTGQDEVDIADVADTVAYVTTPSLGDEIQAMKAGAMEIADIFVVNKADLADKDKTLADLKKALGLLPESTHGWKRPVLPVSTKLNEGLPALLQACADHWRNLSESGQRQQRLRRQLTKELSLYIERKILQNALGRIKAEHIEMLVDRQADPLSLAKRLLWDSLAAQPRKHSRQEEKNAKIGSRRNRR